MRSSVTGLRTPYPLSTLLPAYLQEDEFAVRLTSGLDEVLAPAIAVLDCLDAYVDPWVAPTDFVAWLADWVGATLDEHWDDDRQRLGVLAAAELHRVRGTVEGLRAQLELATGLEVEVLETGGTTWSSRPTEDPAGPAPGLVVRLYVDAEHPPRLAAVEELIELAKPAHLTHQTEVVTR